MPFRGFDEFPNEYFVESGSYLGDGIKAALDAGFPNVISIELTSKYYEHCKSRFRKDRRVTLVHGDTVQVLWDIIRDIDKPITFYLDGHFSGEDTGRGMMDYPLVQELKTIAVHPIKTHTLIIDDVRLFDIHWNLGTKTVMREIRRINKLYSVTFRNGYVEDDVLIAKV